MADEQDESQKTEEPTRKRLEEAAERGQTVTSREATSFFILFTFTLLLGWMLPGSFHKVQTSLSVFIERPESFLFDTNSLGILFKQALWLCAAVLFVPFVAFICAIIFSSAVQNRFVFSVEPIIPKFEKISPLKGIERLFSTRSLAEFGKGVIKLIVVGAVAYYGVVPYLPHIKQLPDVNTFGTLAFLFTTAKRMMIGICIVMFIITVFDYLYQRYEFMKSLRMSKQEIKDEYRQQEGDPQVKQRIRQIRVERSRKRMMAAVPTADVIITNPTHYSIALKYDQTNMRAPTVVAKGLDNIALKIREIAKEHGIPLVENPPLAQALYATVDIDKEIPAEHYKAVAEIISYVYRLKGRFK
ncbi:MAG TPA: flagellar biosynthesis protein FlhB [Rickettsiales bacterium]|nr:flagellar biosynthesis protein FlhB [Rickettsiales bacterium]